MSLHPQSVAFLEAIRVAATPPWYDMDLDVARKTFAELSVFGDGPEVDEVRDEEIAGVPVRFFHVRPEQPRDVIVYFHGGGWVLGDLETHDPLCRRLAQAADATVVSVQYRNPPEHPFPAAAEDCFTVCDVLALDYESFGVSNRMVVAGDSAGGNLAVSVALRARQRGGPTFQGQALIYPVLDSAMETASYHQFANDHGLTADTMAWFWDMYTGEQLSGLRRDPLAAPAIEAELSGLPPTYILLAEYDVLRDEGQQFANRLQAAGVPTVVKHYPGMLHGFVHFAKLFDDSARATQDVAEQCQSMLNGNR